MEFQLNPKTFEYVAGMFTLGATQTAVVVVYRPGSQNIGSPFFDEISRLFEMLVTYNCEIIITGDLNIHLDIARNNHTMKFNQMLECFGLSQHVAGPTHKAGHTLDVFITKTDRMLPFDTSVYPPVISDHSLIIVELPHKKPATVFFNATVRAWKGLDKDAFRRDLISSELCASIGDWAARSADDMVKSYQDILCELLDKHAPKRSIQKRHRPLTPWFNEACVKQKRKSRCLERIYRKTRSAQDRAAWLTQLRSSQAFYAQTKELYWQTTVLESSGNARKLWNKLSVLMGRKSSAPVQDGLNAKSFLDGFKDKVASVRSSTAGSGLPDYTRFDGQRLNQFTTIGEDSVHKLVATAPNKSCGLDPAPTWLIKEFANDLVPFITMLFNKSISTGYFPESFKVAEITLILKKSSLDASIVSNYRLISNLPFLSKLLERAVNDQLQTHIEAANLLPECQSAYRRSHSTETALLSVTSDALMAADRGMMTILGFLDLSAAFDCVDHMILLQRLQLSFGIDSIALQWITSYFRGRSCRVRYNGVLSELSVVDCGVPQGSVLGPKFFLLYTSDVFALAEQHGFFIHGYADDL